MNQAPEELLTREELIEMIHQMRQRQMTHGGITISQAAALQAQRADEAERNLAEVNNKYRQLTDALIQAADLINQLLTELGRLCGASKQPPPLAIFAAKQAFDECMMKLLTNQTPKESRDE
jgi:hypothetical protein